MSTPRPFIPVTKCRCGLAMHVLKRVGDIVYTFCRICDRRTCVVCGHSEQKVDATSCTNCGATYSN